MAEIKQFTKAKDVDYPHAKELLDRVVSLCYEYGGEIGVATVVGVLELAKATIVQKETGV